ncbi:contact-dependent growth inhibition system immunity protein [Calidithermus chliarophilus]|uniref:contact-dependent growth inhibition system immunity protein n=1 Tax=Calidithermus chliarophilus TaxID=52023 RepID=UPI0012F6BCBB|nr:contact-dependent growth inhibition system immunity protein [Calidithermus chliarophilus]
MNETHFPFFKYFLEGYFHAGEDYEDLGEICQRYALYENQQYRKGLLGEATTLLKSKQWGEIGTFIKKYGERNMSPERIESLLRTLIKHIEAEIRKYEDVFGPD